MSVSSNCLICILLTFKIKIINQYWFWFSVIMHKHKYITYYPYVTHKNLFKTWYNHHPNFNIWNPYYLKILLFLFSLKYCGVYLPCHATSCNFLLSHHYKQCITWHLHAMDLVWYHMHDSSIIVAAWMLLQGSVIFEKG